MNESQLIKDDILAFLHQHENKELLRFTTAGSVDDGKSTLIGRLLYDSNNVYEDHLHAMKAATSQKMDEPDFSLLTDGLRAEREQGITIDVAYRYFTTEKRKFIIADTPGHVQYTRNMATGASTANVAIILIDARLGVLQQSRRHAYISALLGIPHLAVAVNKMDLREYSESVFEEIKKDFSEFASKLHFKDVTFTPISALRGDNIVHQSENMPWFQGPPLLQYLEDVPIATDRNLKDFRYPVQSVLRPNLDYRAFAGKIASGVVRKGDALMVLPSRKTSRVQAIDTWEGERQEACAPMSVAIRLEDEVDVSRGCMLVHPDNLPEIGQRFDASLVWMNERALDLGKTYFLKHSSQLVRAEVEAVLSEKNLETLEDESTDTLQLNDIGRVRVRCHREIFFDPYQDNRSTGAFILIDSITNNTVAAGMIIAPASAARATTGAALGTTSQVSSTERRERLGQSGAVVWLVGDTPEQERLKVAYALERCLFDAGRIATVTAPTDEIASKAAPGWLASEHGPETLCQLAERSASAGLVSIFVGSELPQALRDRVGDALCVVAVGGGSGDVSVAATADAEASARAVLQHLSGLGHFDERSR